MSTLTRMNRYLKKLSKLLRNVTRAAKKGFNGVTRSMKKIIHRGGNPNAVPAPLPAPLPAPTAAPVAKLPRRHRKKKGAFRRVTNAVRRVGKGFRNALTRVFTKKAKHRRNKKAVVQRGSSENISTSSGATSSGIPPAPPL